MTHQRRRHLAGGAAAPFVVGLVLILGAAAYFYLNKTDHEGLENPRPESVSQETTAAPAELSVPEGLSGRTEGDPAGPAPVGGVEVRRAGDYGGLRKVFNGTGTIAGDISIAGGGVPDQWTLHIEPSKVARGRDSAEVRIIESEPNMTTFEARDLPMGAYRVYASAPGMRSRPMELALHKLEGQEHLRGMDYVNITLALRPMASVDGTVRTANGDPAEGVPVFLLPHGVQLESPMEAVTDLAGVYRFNAVPKGPWLLHVGAKRNPPASPRPITADTSRMELDDVSLPPLMSVDLLIVDEYARPFPDAEVSGYLRGNGSGSFRGKTDGLGHLIVRHKQPGPWRIEASSEIDGLSGKIDVSLDASEELIEQRIIIR